MNFPEGFVEQMKGLLGNEAPAFFAAMEREPAVSVRLNSRKPSSAFADAERVPWCSQGRYLPERPVFTLDPLLHAGAYYVQDASSMILHELTLKAVAVLQKESGLDIAPKLSAADLCAAPGGKTTAVIDALPDGSRVLANEYVAKRALILRENLAKWGYRDVSVTNMPVNALASRGDKYDLVVVDAPCSGEGMMRKDEDAVKQWSPELIEECARLQQEILTSAAKMVRPGGFLIYSTCTFNRKENEENAQFIADSLGLNPFEPDLPDEWGIGRGIETDLPAYRFMPHITRGEGLFVCLFRKPGDYEPLHIGVKTEARAKAANMGKRVEEPTIDEILAVPGSVDLPHAEVDKETAIRYLRREAIVLDGVTPKGLVVITYEGLPLGCAKNIGSRANNLYPKGWRIRMQ